MNRIEYLNRSSDFCLRFVVYDHVYGKFLGVLTRKSLFKLIYTVTEVFRSSLTTVTDFCLS